MNKITELNKISNAGAKQINDKIRTRGVMVIVAGYGHETRVQILDETDCISHSTNTLEKGMNPIILPPAMGK